MSKKRILILEDDRSLRSMLKEELEAEGFIVHDASDGYMGFKILESIPLPDLIITDLDMPNLDGREFLKQKKQNQLLKKIPTIIVSGVADVDKFTDKTTIAVSKPFDMNELVKSIRAHILSIGEDDLRLLP